MQPPAVFHWNAEPLHQGAAVTCEALLAWNQRVSVMRVLHLLLFHIARGANIVMWPYNEACSFACQKFLDCLDFRRLGFLLHRQMVKTKHHQNISIGENAII